MLDVGRSEMTSRLSAHVRYALLENCVIILDLRAGDYVAITSDHTERWVRLAQGGQACSAEDEHLLEHGLAQWYFGVHDKAKASRSAVTLRPAILAAWWTILRTRRALRQSGFPSLYARCAALTRTEPARLRTLDTLLQTFLKAETLLAQSSVDPQDCLSRSLALFQFLIASGLRATHRIGVCALPFEAHSWVEACDAPLLDQSLYVTRFTSIATLRA